MKQEIKTIDIDGVEASVLVADLNEGQKLSVITNSLLQRLTKLLPKAKTREVISEFVDKLRDYNNSEPKIEGFVQMLQEELDFHKSVNMINEFFVGETKESVKVVHPVADKRNPIVYP